MAISTSSYFSNSIVGIPQVAGESVDIYANDSAPRFAIGTKFERQDGSVFRYSYFANACTAGQVMASVTTDIGFAGVTSAFVSTSSTYQMVNEPVGTYPNGVGSRYIVINTATASALAAAGQYKGGYLTVGAHKNDGIYVANQTYRIKNSTATGTPASGLLRFELYDKLLATITTSAFLSVAGSRYNGLTPADDTIASAVAVPAGVAMNTMTATYFGWVQTRGPVGVILDVEAAGSSAGYLAVLGTSGLGSIIAVANLQTSGASLIPAMLPIGVCMSAASSTTTCIVNLSIE